MAKLRLATDRSGSGVLASDAQSRDIQIQSYSLSFHGRLLIENADFSLNYGQRCASDCRAGPIPGIATKLWHAADTVSSERTDPERCARVRTRLTVAAH